MNENPFFMRVAPARRLGEQERFLVAITIAAAIVAVLLGAALGAAS